MTDNEEYCCQTKTQCFWLAEKALDDYGTLIVQLSAQGMTASQREMSAQAGAEAAAPRKA